MCHLKISMKEVLSPKHSELNKVFTIIPNHNPGIFQERPENILQISNTDNTDTIFKMPICLHENFTL